MRPGMEPIGELRRRCGSMRTSAGNRRRGSGLVTALSLPLALLFGVTACDGFGRAGDSGDAGRGRDELADFIDAAERADCARDVNRIYRIDHAWVLWQREDLGCADAAYEITLYGASPDAELCSSYQT